ncbi:peroxidase 16-like protein [Cinnamomum micranthum f. kanehirae]|uniref:Peroxidase 16-like protein n=1 Tax=Cinnamomum micranthum f. kanehirae TaxID=337451 RepID=A0A3S3NU51_9MAGN|nr:peroxidase 16-like protein [Cinnamomum micranthum f. kanehirae]
MILAMYISAVCILARRTSASRPGFPSTICSPAWSQLGKHHLGSSMLLASPHSKAEKDSPDDISLAGDGFDTVIKAKTAIDRDPRCQNKAGGPFYQVELGRLYGIISTKRSVRHHLPQPTFNSDPLNAMFALHGLSQTDMTTLSGTDKIRYPPPFS